METTMKFTRIETRFFAQACDLRDALLDLGHEPSEIEKRTESWFLVPTTLGLVHEVLTAARDIDLATVWIDGIRFEVVDRVIRAERDIARMLGAGL